MKESKIVATVHYADNINSGLDVVGGGKPFYSWRIGEVNFYFDTSSNIVNICNRTLATIEKLERDRARADVKEIAHF